MFFKNIKMMLWCLILLVNRRNLIFIINLYFVSLRDVAIFDQIECILNKKLKFLNRITKVSKPNHVIFE